jgi:DNA repair protein RadA/Sms
VTVLVAGQVTKEGDIAGPRTLEHAVDVVCSFGGDPRTGLRIVCGGKNRFGPEGEVAWFEMTSDGLTEVDPSAVVAPSDGEVGAATALAAAGRGVLAVEIQALAVPSEVSPRRHVSGLDALRFGLVAAVVDRSVGLPLARAELYAATPGGLRIDDSTCDLAIAAALASTATGIPPPPRSAFSGEVSLTGTVRPPPNLKARLAAAAARGVRLVFCAGEPVESAGVEVAPVRHVRDALVWAGSPRKPRS